MDATSKCETAFAVFVGRHLPSVVQCARLRLDNASLGEDVALTVFAILARKATTLSTHPCLRGWLLQTTYFVARRRNRSENRRSNAMRHYQDSVTSSTSHERHNKERQHLLDRLLERLHADERNILLLHHVEGHSFREIGTLLGKSEGSCRVRAHRALQKLSHWVQQHGSNGNPTIIGAALGSYFLSKAPHVTATAMAEAARSRADSIGTTTMARLSLHASGVFGHVAITLSAIIVLACGVLFVQVARLHRMEGATQTARTVRTPPSLSLTRAPTAYRSDLLEHIRRADSTFDVNALVQNTLQYTFLGAPNYTSIALEQKDLSTLREHLSDLNRHPMSPNFKPTTQVLWAICELAPQEACEFALEYTGIP